MLSEKEKTGGQAETVGLSERTLSGSGSSDTDAKEQIRTVIQTALGLFAGAWETQDQGARRTGRGGGPGHRRLRVVKEIQPDVCSRQGPPAPAPVAVPCGTWALCSAAWSWELFQGPGWTAGRPLGSGDRLVTHVFTARGTRDYADLDGRGDSRHWMREEAEGGRTAGRQGGGDENSRSCVIGYSVRCHVKNNPLLCLPTECSVRCLSPANCGLRMTRVRGLHSRRASGRG